MVAKGFAKLSCVWGVVIAGTKDMPDNNLLYAANVAAELLDPDATGKPKNEEIRKRFAVTDAGSFLGGGVTEAEEKAACGDTEEGNDGADTYCYSY